MLRIPFSPRRYTSLLTATLAHLRNWLRENRQRTVRDIAVNSRFLRELLAASTSINEPREHLGGATPMLLFGMPLHVDDDIPDNELRVYWSQTLFDIGAP